MRKEGFVSGVVRFVCVGDGVLCTLPFSRQVPQLMHAFNLIIEEENLCAIFSTKLFVWKIIIILGDGGRVFCCVLFFFF